MTNKSFSKASKHTPVVVNRSALNSAPRAPLVPKRQILSNTVTKPFLQSGFKISPANDKYEQEADRAAEQVMQAKNTFSEVQTIGSAAVSNPARPTQIPRLYPECKEGFQHRPLLPVASLAAPNINVLDGSGQPLPQAERRFFEARFGHDFSQVRVHADTRGAQAAQWISAQAFTVGRNIVFGSGEYQPQSREGRQLMAHELAHVVQQGRQHGHGAPAIQRKAPKPGETERELIGDAAVVQAVNEAWFMSFGHEPFSSEQSYDELGLVQYREGGYEGVDYRESYFFIDESGKPTAIQTSDLPLDIRNVSYPPGILAFVHTHPSQKRAATSETGDSGNESALTVDEQAVKSTGIPVYVVARNNVLKIYLDNGIIRTKRFSRRRLGISTSGRGHRDVSSVSPGHKLIEGMPGAGTWTTEDARGSVYHHFSTAGAHREWAFRPVYEYTDYLRLFRPSEYEEVVGSGDFFSTYGKTTTDIAEEFGIMLFEIIREDAWRYDPATGSFNNSPGGGPVGPESEQGSREQDKRARQLYRHFKQEAERRALPSSYFKGYMRSKPPPGVPF